MGGKGFELRWSRQAPGALLGWMVESGRREGKKKEQKTVQTEVQMKVLRWRPECYGNGLGNGGELVEEQTAVMKVFLKDCLSST